MVNSEPQGSFSSRKAATHAASASLLFAVRRANGLSLRDIAQRVGVNSTTVFRWETGQRVPGAVNARALERALGLPAETLLSTGSYEVAVIR
jgi:transcriptional regulator with XRE-family HTH domain